MKTRLKARIELEMRRKLKQKYKTVSFQDAQANPEFSQMMENMFREQAARVIPTPMAFFSSKRIQRKIY